MDHVIGEEGMGFTYQMLQFQEERLAAAAGCLVPLTTVLEETIAYTRSLVLLHLHPPRERQAFGAPLLDNQYIHFRLAELHTEVELVWCSWSWRWHSCTSPSPSWSWYSRGSRVSWCPGARRHLHGRGPDDRGGERHHARQVPDPLDPCTGPTGMDPCSLCSAAC